MYIPYLLSFVANWLSYRVLLLLLCIQYICPQVHGCMNVWSVCAHTQTHTHMHTHTHAHSHSHSHTHTRTHTYAHSYVRGHTHTHTHTCTHTCIPHAHTRTHTHTHMHITETGSTQYIAVVTEGFSIIFCSV